LKTIFWMTFATWCICLTSFAANAGTLEDVKVRGYLNCGVNPGLVGFASPNEVGEWVGFDVDLCRAVALAVFGRADAVKFVPLESKERFNALSSNQIDVLSRNSTWTFSRDVGLRLDFVGVSYYDGQGFLISKDADIQSALDLGGARICVEANTTTELNLSDYFQARKIKYLPVRIENPLDGKTRYLAGECDVYTADASALAATRATFERPSNHLILPEVISKEPLGPVVRHGDNQWADIVRWTLNALIDAEEFGITSKNVKNLAATTVNRDIGRLLGTQDSLGTQFGLQTDWVVNVIAVLGNYGEIFERNIGKDTAIGLERGLNAQWQDGGLLYAPPFR